jgi:hypothetical protein
MIRTTRRAVRATLGVAVPLVLVLVLGGCSGGGSDPDEPDPSSAPPEAVPGVSTTVAYGKVTGRLDRDKRASLRERVTATFDSWVDAAYVADDHSDAFSVFTTDAARLAQRDAGLMSNSGLGERVDSVTATSRKLTIDVLAANGRPVGVTGRFVLVLEMEGDVQRTDRIAGRLLLRSLKDGWHVFGYDVKRGRVA